MNQGRNIFQTAGFGRLLHFSLQPLAFSLFLAPLFCGSAAEQPSAVSSSSHALPVRGLHLTASSKKDLPIALQFIREVLPRERVNTLILEFDYNFDFQSRPEFASPSSLGKEDVEQLVKACRENQINLIPQLNCLGHQSWAKRNGRLLEKHPDFDETPGKYPNNEGIYCRSYCPLHPEVHHVIFDLIDELARACEAKSFHIGMDEVFTLADPDCPRCKGKDPAQLFAREAKTLQAHLKEIGCRMWMWGDRLLDARSTSLGKWEASEIATQSAIDLLPMDIVICDWHYDKAPETALFFARKGFDVVACPWRKPAVALSELSHIQAIRSGADAEAARHALGMLQTTWCGFSAFARACKDQEDGAASEQNSASQSARCFLTLFKAMREKQQPAQ